MMNLLARWSRQLVPLELTHRAPRFQTVRLKSPPVMRRSERLQSTSVGVNARSQQQTEKASDVPEETHSSKGIKAEDQVEERTTRKRVISESVQETSPSKSRTKRTRKSEIKVENTNEEADTSAASLPSLTVLGTFDDLPFPDEKRLQVIRQRAARSRKYVGAHVSAKGGVFNAIVNSLKIGACAFGLFLKSQRKHQAPPLTEQVVATFHQEVERHDVHQQYCLPHGSYLVNLGNRDQDKWQQSYNNMLDDLKRCESLNIPLWNFHAGSSNGEVSKEEAIKTVAIGITRALRETEKVKIVIENSAGQGNCIGVTFEEIGSIIQQVPEELRARVGVCLDTCHMFAAGYDVRTSESFSKVMDDFDRIIGLRYLSAMHLNDSKGDLGCRKDRHELLGKGLIGLECFRFIMHDKRFQDIPLILETPVPKKDGKEDFSVWRDEIDLLYSFVSNPTVE